MSKIKDYSAVTLKTNEKNTKVEQKLARTLRKEIIAEMSSVFDTVEVVGTKTYGLIQFADNQLVTVELNAVIKSLDFEV